MLYQINSKFGRYAVNADNISEARYTYSTILSEKFKVDFNTIYESITESIEISFQTSIKSLN